MAVDRTVKRSASPGGSAPLREDELENYGVWVKSEPQDLVEGIPGEASAASLDSFSPEIPELKDETFLTEEEESLLDEVDASAGRDAPRGAEPMEIDFSADELAVPPMDAPDVESVEEIPVDIAEGEETLIPLEDVEDFSVPEAEELPDIALLSGDGNEKAPAEPDIEELASPEEIGVSTAPPEGETEEISLEEFGVEDEIAPVRADDAFVPPAGNEDVSLDDFLDSSDFGISDKREEEARQALSQEPIDLDLEFDDDAQFETLSISKDNDEDLAEVEPARDIARDEERPRPESTIETEEVNDFDDVLSEDSLGPVSLQFTDDKANAAGLDIDTGLEEAGLVEDAGIEDQTALVLDADAESVGIDIDEDAMSREAGIDFSHYAQASAETDELLSGIDFAESAPVPEGFGAKAPAADATVEPIQALRAEEEPFDDIAAVESELADEEEDVAKIREDADVSATLLHQIAGELSDIKRELSSLKDQLSAIRGGSPENKAAAQPDESKPTGFFDEEEDETIALTGDELDNILNTAQFSEETGSSEDGAASSGGVQEDVLDDIIPLDDAQAVPPVPPVQGLGDDEDDKGLSDLLAIEDEGLSPMTEPPEDTSYLEEPLKEELEGAVLPDTPLEEPDLSDFLVDEAPLEEEIPVIDGGDLVVELPEEAEGELEDITLDLSPDASVAPDIIPEAPRVPAKAAAKPAAKPIAKESPEALKGDIKSVLQYMDRLLESLPEDKIEEFARSEHFNVYKRLFEELGLV
jgi:pilus assembly protein FimV